MAPHRLRPMCREPGVGRGHHQQVATATGRGLSERSLGQTRVHPLLRWRLTRSRSAVSRWTLRRPTTGSGWNPMCLHQPCFRPVVRRWNLMEPGEPTWAWVRKRKPVHQRPVALVAVAAPVAPVVVVAAAVDVVAVNPASERKRWMQWVVRQQTTATTWGVGCCATRWTPTTTAARPRVLTHGPTPSGTRHRRWLIADAVHGLERRPLHRWLVVWHVPAGGGWGRRCDVLAPQQAIESAPPHAV